MLMTSLARDADALSSIKVEVEVSILGSLPLVPDFTQIYRVTPLRALKWRLKKHITRIISSSIVS